MGNRQNVLKKCHSDMIRLRNTSLSIGVWRMKFRTTSYNCSTQCSTSVSNRATRTRLSRHSKPRQSSTKRPPSTSPTTQAPRRRASRSRSTGAANWKSGCKKWRCGTCKTRTPSSSSTGSLRTTRRSTGIWSSDPTLSSERKTPRYRN